MSHGFNSSTGQRMNEKLILSMLMRQQANTRIELSRMTGLTQATVSNIVTPLISIGLIDEYPIISNSVGRRSIGLKINDNRFHVIHLRIVSQQFVVGRFNLAGKELSRYTQSYAADMSPEGVMILIKQNIQKILNEDRGVPILGIGVSLPSPYSNGRSFEQFSVLKDWNDIDICAEIKRCFSLAVYAENDANVGALSEWQQDPSLSDDDTLLYLSLSEGTGCGIISGGRLFRGKQGFAGEVGHMTIDVHGPRCRCGRRGCLELYTSTCSLRDIARARSKSVGTATLLRPTSSTTEFFDAVRLQDSIALPIFEEAMEYLNYGIMNLIYLYNPSIIVFGDEMIMQQMGDMILRYQKQALYNRLPPELMEKLTLRVSSASANPAFLGAGSLVISHMTEILYEMHILGN